MVSEKQKLHLYRLAMINKGKPKSLEHRKKLSIAKFKTGKPICKCGKVLSTYGVKRCKPCFAIERFGRFVKEEVGYCGVHRWIRRVYGTANVCENPLCESVSITFEWSLLKGKQYERVRENFWQLCKKCHERYDENYKNRKRNIDGTFGKGKHTRMDK